MFKNAKKLFVLSTALLLAACGGGEEGTNNATGSNGDAQTVTVAVENASNPLSFTNTSGELDGYEVELIKMLDEEMEDYELNIESVDAEATQVGLDTGKYAFIGGGLYKTEERAQMYLFPEEHSGASKVSIYKRADDESIQTIDDLTNVKVHPVTPNGGMYNLLVEYNENHPDNQIDIQLGDSGNYAERFQALNDGISDAIIQPSNLGAEDIIEQLNLNVTEVEEPVQVNATYFVLGKDQEELKIALDAALKTLKENGELTELSEKWYGEDMFQYEITE